MEKTQAWERLHDPESGRLRMVELRDLMIRAGYPIEEAHKAAKQRGWERLAAGVEI